MNQAPEYNVRLEEAENFLNMGDYASAESCFQDLCQQDTGNPQLHFQLGLALHIQGKFDPALQSYEQALRIFPDFPEAHNNAGMIKQREGNLNQALDHYKEALRLHPDFTEAMINLANVLHQQGECNEAETMARRAVAANSSNSRALNTLGVILKTAGRIPEAINVMKKAIVLDPQYIEAHNNLGNAYKLSDDLEQASNCYENALSLDPQNIETLINLGNTGQALGRPDIALQCFELSLDEDPQFAEAHWNRAVTLLLMGDYARGWAEYEWGFAAGQRILRHQELPVWDGSVKSYEGIIVYREQGLGDTLQFVRYLALIRNMGLRVVLECQPELVSLIEHSGIADQVIDESKGVSSTKCDAAISIMSLPHLFGTLLDTISSKIPYIQPDPSKVYDWRERLNQDGNFKIGIVWSGSPHHQNDRHRSCSPDYFRLLAKEGVTFYSLQKDAHDLDVGKFGNRLVDLSAELHDFSDTAAIVQNMDLVITVDTSVAHLAGAMNKPVWVLLPFAPDWRWLLDREDCPWYPSARLFRQECPGSWETTFNKVVNCLAETLVHNK